MTPEPTDERADGCSHPPREEAPLSITGDFAKLRFTRLEALRVRQLRLHHLRDEGITFSDIETRRDGERPEVTLLREIIKETLNAFDQYEKRGIPGSQDTAPNLFDYFTRPTAVISLLEARTDPSKEWGDEGTVAVGYGLVYESLDDAPDCEYIRSHWNEIFGADHELNEGTWSGVIRGSRAVVTDLGRRIGAEGLAMDRIMHEHEIIAAGRDIVIIIQDDPQFRHDLAFNALVPRGHEATGCIMHQTLPRVHEGDEVTVQRQYYLYPPRNPETRAAALERQARIAQSETYKLNQILLATTHADPSKPLAVIDVLSPDKAAERNSRRIRELFQFAHITGISIDLESPEAYTSDPFQWPGFSYLQTTNQQDLIPRDTFGFVFLTNSMLVDLPNPQAFVADLEPRCDALGIRTTILPSVGDKYPKYVYLNLPLEKPQSGEGLAALSQAELFETYVRKVSTLTGKELDVIRLDDPKVNQTARFRVEYKDAVEFLLKRNYFIDWDTQILREYTKFRAEDVVRLGTDAGLRIRAMRYERNGHVHQGLDPHNTLTTIDEQPIPLPATNFEIAFEKPESPVQGIVRKRIWEPDRSAPTFLHLEGWARSQRDGKSNKNPRDIFRIPPDFQTVDVVLWSRRGNQIWLDCRDNARAIVSTFAEGDEQCRAVTLNGLPNPGMLTETTSQIIHASDLREHGVEEIARRIAQTRAARDESQIINVGHTTHGLSCPLLIDEGILRAYVQVTPDLVPQFVESAHSGVSIPSKRRSLPASQIIGIGQTGGTVSGRLERAAYELHIQEGDMIGPYLGERLEIHPERKERVRFAELPIVSRDELLQILEVRDSDRFRRLPRPVGFLKHLVAEYAQVRTDGEVVQETLESGSVSDDVESGNVGANVLPIVALETESGEKEYYGVFEKRRFVAAQLNYGNDGSIKKMADIPSELEGNPWIRCCPSFVLPEEFEGRPDLALKWTDIHLQNYFRFELLSSTQMTGSEINPSGGLLPFSVQPMTCQVAADSLIGSEDLVLCRLDDIKDSVPGMRDEMSQTTLYRMLSQLGIIK